MRQELNIIHVMSNGTVKSSIEGMTIRNEQFYKVLGEILKKGDKK